MTIPTPHTYHQFIPGRIPFPPYSVYVLDVSEGEYVNGRLFPPMVRYVITEHVGKYAFVFDKESRELSVLTFNELYRPL